MIFDLNSCIITTIQVSLNRRSFLKSSHKIKRMKYEELHKIVRKAGWKLVRTKGSHRIYKRGSRTYPVPFHGGKEVGKGLASKVIKEMEL